MGIIRVENRGKNLLDLINYTYLSPAMTITYISDNIIELTGYYKWSAGIGYKVPVKRGQVYTIYVTNGDFTRYTLNYTKQGFYTWDSDQIKPPTDHWAQFTPTQDYVYIYFWVSSAVYTTCLFFVEKPILVEGDYSKSEMENMIYEPPRNDYIEFDGELFGYAGVYDELRDDGTLIKRWKKLTDSDLAINYVTSLTNVYKIATTSIPNFVSSSDNTNLIALKEDGTPLQPKVHGLADYEHCYLGAGGHVFVFVDKSTIDAESGSTIEEKALNYLKKMTLIGKLATPETINLNYDGELILHPGENNLILPDFAVASISGARKYLEG